MCLAVPAKVVEVLADERARVEVGGFCQEISVGLLDEVAVGDYVIVHVGFALRRLDPEEAQRTLDLFAEYAEAIGESPPQ